MDRNIVLDKIFKRIGKFKEYTDENLFIRDIDIPIKNFAGRDYSCRNFAVAKDGRCVWNNKCYASLQDIIDRKEYVRKEDKRPELMSTLPNMQVMSREEHNAAHRNGLFVIGEIGGSDMISKMPSIPMTFHGSGSGERQMRQIKARENSGAANRQHGNADNKIPQACSGLGINVSSPTLHIPNGSGGVIDIGPAKPDIVKTVLPVARTSTPGNPDMDRMKELVEKLNEARRVYEQGTDEIMSNFEYDKLYDELVELEIKTNTILPNSPTQEVGYEVVSNLPKIEHKHPMLSLGKTKEVSDLKSFLGDKEGQLGWKLDGLTVVLTFKGGVLVQGVTRGNGYIGEDVTNNAKTFINVPKKISYDGELILRAEALMSYETFEKIKATPEGAEYKNPRNLASGSVRQLDSSVTARRDIRAVVFDWVNAPDHYTKEEQIAFVKGLGFEVVQNVKVTSSTVAEAVAGFSAFVEKMKYPTDGLVLTYDNVAYGKKLGVTAKTPKHSIAFKWQDEVAETELLDIEWQTGRTGVITPVAIFKPVDLEGTTVNRASLHNISILEELLGRPYVGQRIKVYKANMIIPQVCWGDKEH